MVLATGVLERGPEPFVVDLFHRSTLLIHEILDQIQVAKSMVDDDDDERSILCDLAARVSGV